MGRILHQHDPLPQVTAQASYVPVGAEGSRQQSVGVQLLQPLAVQHVGLATRHVLDAPRSTSITWKPRSPAPRTAVSSTRRWTPPVSTPHSVSQSAKRYRSAVKANSCTGCSARSATDVMAGGPHVNAGRVQVQLGQPCRFCAAGASAHHRLYHFRVGVSPEGATDCSHSPQRDRPDRGVTNDAVVRLPDHATVRAISTSVCSVFVRTTLASP